MRILARIGLTVVLVLLGIGHAVAQTATLSGDLLADWRQQKRTMMGIAEAMPEEAFSFKPTDAQRTYAEQILHIAGANVYLMQHLGGAAAAPDVDTTDFTVFGLSATSKAGVLEALSAGYDYGIAVLQEFSDGRPLKILTVIEEYSRECLAIVVARRLRSLEVLETLAELFVTYGVPVHLRSDNGPEFTAALIRQWLAALHVETLFIEPRSPWENGYVESFNGKLRDELLDREIFYTLTEAKILIERWRRQYNTVRPHSALGYPATGPGSHQPNAPERPDHEPSSLIRTGSTLGGRSGSSRGGRGIAPEPGGVAARRLSVYAEAVAPTGPTNPLKSSLTFAPVSWPRRHAGVGVINHLFVGYCHVITVA